MTTINNSENSIGFILPTIRAIIAFLSKYTAYALFFKGKKDFEQDAYIKGKQAKTVSRSDAMNSIWFIISIIAYSLINLTFIENKWRYLFLIPIILRQLNIISWILRPIFVEPHNPFSSTLINITSYQRNLLYAFFHYIELIILFASIYSICHNSINYDKTEVDFFTNLYFSGVSQLTIGYGDIVPRCTIRFVVLLQSLIGLIIFALSVGTLIGKVVLKDETK